MSEAKRKKVGGDKFFFLFWIYTTHNKSALESVRGNPYTHTSESGEAYCRVITAMISLTRVSLLLSRSSHPTTKSKHAMSHAALTRL